MSIDTFLATRLRTLRTDHGLTLQQLAERSGVSRSMLSLIERGETSPTAAVLDRLAGAFGLSLPAFFATPAAEAADTAAPEPVARKSAQALWTDPASGYQRRQLSPPGVASPMELVEITFPPGATVLFDNPLRRAGPLPQVSQQLWLLAGRIEVRLDGEATTLQAGDCMAMTLGAQIAFHNPGAQPARYLLATARGSAPSRSPA